MSDIAVIGVGAIGGVVAARLCAAGRRETFYAGPACASLVSCPEPFRLNALCCSTRKDPILPMLGPGRPQRFRLDPPSTATTTGHR